MLFKPLCLPKMYGMDENSKKLVFIKERNSVYIQYLILKFVKKKNMKNDCICKLMSSGVSCKPSHVVQTSFAIPCFDKVLNCNKI